MLLLTWEYIKYLTKSFFFQEFGKLLILLLRLKKYKVPGFRVRFPCIFYFTCYFLRLIGFWTHWLASNGMAQPWSQAQFFENKQCFHLVSTSLSLSTSTVTHDCLGLDLLSYCGRYLQTVAPNLACV